MAGIPQAMIRALYRTWQARASLAVIKSLLSNALVSPIPANQWRLSSTRQFAGIAWSRRRFRRGCQ
jgi:hypothetical protein